MLKRGQKLSKNRGKCLLTAFGMTAAAALTGTLTSRLISRGVRKPARGQEAYADLLHSVSQSLRDPLSGIMGNSLVYLENHTELTDQEKLNLVTGIHEDSERLANIAENLLTLLRIQDRGLNLATGEEAVEEVVGEALQKMDTRHPGCMIRARIPEHFLQLPMDAPLIEQVIINLLEYSLLRGDNGKPVDIIVEENAENVSFTVRDHGPRLPKDNPACLFDGTEMGLDICKAIITAHHGTITAMNHSRGAEFVFTLPK